MRRVPVSGIEGYFGLCGIEAALGFINSVPSIVDALLTANPHPLPKVTYKEIFVHLCGLSENRLNPSILLRPILVEEIGYCKSAIADRHSTLEFKPLKTRTLSSI